MAAAMVGIVIGRKKFAQYRHDILHSSITKADFREMNRLGWPVALQLGMESSAFTLSCVMVGWLGTIPLAAHQVMITLSQLFYLVLSGMAERPAARPCRRPRYRAGADGCLRTLETMRSGRIVPTGVYQTFGHLSRTFDGRIAEPIKPRYDYASEIIASGRRSG
jgi:hypothetical protein